jgi:A/G-specific adenine glycosylase
LDEQCNDEVPDTYAELIALPGIGEYTASAVMAFAFGKRSVVIDTNIRRVLARALTGQQWPATSISNAERESAQQLVPHRDEDASLWSAAVMELGAVICVAGQPRCDECPIASHCLWFAAGKPQQPRPHRTQTWHGTDRQCRGKILAILRENDFVVDTDMNRVWDVSTQLEKCLEALVQENFIERSDAGWRLAG